MNFLAWIILGGLSGWIASMITGKESEMGIPANIVIGIIGAFIGGAIFRFFGGAGITGFNIWSAIVSVIGAVILLSIIKAVKKKS